MLRPVSTKPFFLTYVKRETDVRKKNWLSGHGLFGNRPADTVRSIPSDRRLTVNRQKRTGDKSAQWTRAFIMELICIDVALAKRETKQDVDKVVLM